MKKNLLSFLFFGCEYYKLYVTHNMTITFTFLTVILALPLSVTRTPRPPEDVRQTPSTIFGRKYLRTNSIQNLERREKNRKGGFTRRKVRKTPSHFRREEYHSLFLGWKVPPHLSVLDGTSVVKFWEGILTRSLFSRMQKISRKNLRIFSNFLCNCQFLV